MALGILMIIYIVLVIIGIFIQISLYSNKGKSKNNIFIINMLFGILLSYLAYTSFPTNYTSQRALAMVFALIPILSVILKSRSEKFMALSKIMLSVSIFASFLLLFL